MSAFSTDEEEAEILRQKQIEVQDSEDEESSWATFDSDEESDLDVKDRHTASAEDLYSAWGVAAELEDGPVNVSHSGVLNSQPGSLVDIKVQMRRFLAKHGVGFERWWNNQSADERIDFILYATFHAMYFSPEDDDRWSYKNGDRVKGKRIRHNQFLRYVCCHGYNFTFGYLAEGKNLINLLRDWTTDGILFEQMPEVVLKFREYVAEGIWPDTIEMNEQRKSINLEEGLEGPFVSLMGNMRLNSTEDILDMDIVKFQSSKHFVVVDPKRFSHLDPTSYICLDIVGKDICAYPDVPYSATEASEMYEMGLITTFLEFKIGIEQCCMMQFVLSRILDEYQEQVLKIDTSIPLRMKALPGCGGFCDKGFGDKVGTYG